MLSQNHVRPHNAHARVLLPKLLPQLNVGRPLRSRRERPHDGSAAEQRYELAAPHSIG
jgi:hypothetical protein